MRGVGREGVRETWRGRREEQRKEKEREENMQGNIEKGEREGGME